MNPTPEQRAPGAPPERPAEDASAEQERAEERRAERRLAERGHAEERLADDAPPPAERPPEERPDTREDVMPDVAAVVDEEAFRAHTADDTRAAELEVGRGRQASAPSEIPGRGWWDILRRVFVKIDEQNVSILAAGVAFYAMLAIFPALGAIVTLYALVADPGDVQTHFGALAGILPPDVAGIFDDQLISIAERGEERLGIGLVIGLLVSVWIAHRSIDALVRAITVAYEERETRGIVRMNVLTYVLTFGAILLVVTTIALLVALPTVLAFLQLSGLVKLVGRAGGWLLFVGVVMFALSVLYRYAPPRRPARWRWVSPGAVVATLLWIVGSAGFSFYVTSFGNYNETYGTLGAIVVLLLWFFLTAFAIVLGAALNAEMEHQTARDTTVGGPQPMGERGAYVADTLGEVP